MSNSYIDFNMQNCAPPNCRMIAVYNEKGKVGFIKVPDRMIASGRKQYSFMAVSDSHVQNGSVTDGANDLTRAVNFANNTDVAFICHCGDTADAGTDWHLSKFKAIIDNSTKPVYAISGNHEEDLGNQTFTELGKKTLEPYFGKELFYDEYYGDDVFIFMGESGYGTGNFFAEKELKFMYDTLEANRNKRCFVFMHALTLDNGDSGNPTGYYHNDLFYAGNVEYRQKEKKCFLNMLKHYKNTIWFHGHSHALFELQTYQSWGNYSDKLGYRSVHIPSLARPKDANGNEVHEGSQGYIIDVYDDFIVLKGRDFVAGKFLPIATYKIDTTLQTVAEKTFVDTTGILDL